jgi:hypothetical protein
MALILPYAIKGKKLGHGQLMKKLDSRQQVICTNHVGMDKKANLNTPSDSYYLMLI